MTPLLKAFHYLPKIGQYFFGGSLSVIVNEVKKIIPNERLFAVHYVLTMYFTRSKTTFSIDVYSSEVR